VPLDKAGSPVRNTVMHQLATRARTNKIDPHAPRLECKPENTDHRYRSSIEHPHTPRLE
jgi:hypothetical protein